MSRQITSYLPLTAEWILDLDYYRMQSPTITEEIEPPKKQFRCFIKLRGELNEIIIQNSQKGMVMERSGFFLSNNFYVGNEGMVKPS